MSIRGTMIVLYTNAGVFLQQITPGGEGQRFEKSSGRPERGVI